MEYREFDRNARLLKNLKNIKFSDFKNGAKEMFRRIKLFSIQIDNNS
jgi:hypothetical protein